MTAQGIEARQGQDAQQLDATHESPVAASDAPERCLMTNPSNRTDVTDAMIEAVARAIAEGCNLDPDAVSPRTNKAGHTIPEWMFFGSAATKAIAALRSAQPVDNISKLEGERDRLREALRAYRQDDRATRPRIGSRDDE